jgi:arachidonate 15-lipoxygenase
VVGPDGHTQSLMAATISESLRLTREAVRGTRMTGIGIRADLARRGVADTTALPIYPFRDDVLPVADAIERWVDDYIRLYYHDRDVRSDTELHAWLAALGAPDAGQLAGIPDVDNVADLVRFASDLVYRATAFHAAINYSCYDYMGFPPNHPTAAYGPGPSPRRTPTEADLLAMMPPLHLALRMTEFMYRLKVMRHNRLGDYPHGHFTDARVKPILGRFVRTLQDIEVATAERNVYRPFPYPYLLPSLITASIHV